MKYRQIDTSPATTSLYGWSGAGSNWVVYLREVTDTASPRCGQSEVVASFDNEADAQADAFARDAADNHMVTANESAWERQWSLLRARDAGDDVSDSFLVTSADLSDDDYNYEPDEVADSLHASQFYARQAYVPLEPWERELAAAGRSSVEPTPYSPGAIPDRLSVAWRPVSVKRSVEEEHEWIRLAQSQDNDAFVKLLEAYSRILCAKRNRLMVGAGVPRNHAEYRVLHGFTEALMLFDVDAAKGGRGRLAGGQGAQQTLAQYIADAEWAARMEELPVHVPKRTLQEYFAILSAADADGSASSDRALRGTARLSSVDAAILLRWHMVTRLVEADGDESDEVHTDHSDFSVLPLHMALSEPELARAASSATADMAEIALSVLDESQYAMVCALMGFEGEPVSQGEFAAQEGISQPTVSQRLAKALDTMRDALTANEEEA